MWLVATTINSPAVDPPLSVGNMKDRKNEELSTD